MPRTLAFEIENSKNSFSPSVHLSLALSFLLSSVLSFQYRASSCFAVVALSRLSLLSWITFREHNKEADARAETLFNGKESIADMQVLSVDVASEQHASTPFTGWMGSLPFFCVTLFCV